MARLFNGDSVVLNRKSGFNNSIATVKKSKLMFNVEMWNGSIMEIDSDMVDYTATTKMQQKSNPITIDDVQDGWVGELSNGVTVVYVSRFKRFYNIDGGYWSIENFDKNFEYTNGRIELYFKAVYDRNKSLMWFRQDKKSEQQIKIEELEKTVALATKQIEELKRGLNEK